MPLYDYECEAGHRYEKQQPFGSPAQHPCEQCGRLARRQFSTPKVVRKGEGWRSAGPAHPDSESYVDFDTSSSSSAAQGPGCCGQ